MVEEVCFSNLLNEKINVVPDDGTERLISSCVQNILKMKHKSCKKDISP